MSGKSTPKAFMGIIPESSSISAYPENRSNSPSVDEEEYDTDLEVEEEKSTFDHTGRSNYINACKHHGIVPASYFLRHMQDEVLNMQHHGLSAGGVKAMALPLMNNTSVLCLNLGDNWLGGDGGESISNMLKENCYISELNISWNKLGRRGAIAVCDMLMLNTTLQVLDLSGNDFTDAEAGFFFDALNENNRVRILNLSNNQFGDKSAAILAPAISENDTVEELDLSWNHFRPKGIKLLCDGIKNNARLRVLDLSFNGIGNDGAAAIAEVLQLHQLLQDLRLHQCRISTQGALSIAKGMDGNEILKILNLGNNPLGAEGAKTILASIMHENCGVTCLDISGVEVDKEFISTKNEFLKQKDVTILHGLVLGYYVINPRKKKSGGCLFGVPLSEINAENLFQNLGRYCEQEKVSLGEHLKGLFKKGDNRILSTDFVSGIITSGLQISDEQINNFIELLRGLEDSDGYTDISYFV